MRTAVKPSSPPVEILIAEDSPAQVQKLQHILEQQGYEVTIAANGLVALKRCNSHVNTRISTDTVGG